MLWQLFLKQTHAHSHADTHTHTHTHTHGSRQGHFLWNEYGGISSTPSQCHFMTGKEGRGKVAKGEREREREREREGQPVTVCWNNGGDGRDKHLTSLFQKDQPVGRVSVQVWWEFMEGRGKQWTRTNPRSGRDGRERPINSAQEGTAAPISDRTKPPSYPLFLHLLLDSHHGYPHPVSLVPPGLPTSILWLPLGRTSHWLATYLALVLVLPLDAPFVHALVQLVRQWPQWGTVKLTSVLLADKLLWFLILLSL